MFTTQLIQFNDNNKWDRSRSGALKDEDSKYKWKLKAPKDGESSSKMVLSDGKRKKYHWCEYNKLWTIHSPKECKKQPTGKNKGRKALYKKASKYNQKKKACMKARAAFASFSEEDSVSDNESNTHLSNTHLFILIYSVPIFIWKLLKGFMNYIYIILKMLKEIIIYILSISNNACNIYIYIYIYTYIHI